MEGGEYSTGVTVESIDGDVRPPNIQQRWKQKMWNDWMWSNNFGGKRCQAVECLLGWKQYKIQQLDVTKESNIPLCPQSVLSSIRLELGSGRFLLVECQTKWYKMFTKSEKLKVVVDRVVTEHTSRVSTSTFFSNWNPPLGILSVAHTYGAVVYLSANGLRSGFQRNCSYYH